MAIIREGVNGPFRGKVGSIIGSSWRKVNYIKGLSRPRKGAPSAAQLAHQQKFKLLIKFLNKIKWALDIGFNQYTSKAMGINAAFSYNYDHAFIGEGDTLALNFSALQLSRGSLYPAGDEQAVLDGEHLHLSWNTKTYGMGGEADDQVIVVVRSPMKDGIEFWPGTWSRLDSAGTISRRSWAHLSPADFQVWLFLVDSQSRKASSTVYIPVSPPTP